QQIAFDHGCRPPVSDRVSKGELPVALRGGAPPHRGAKPGHPRTDSPGGAPLFTSEAANTDKLAVYVAEGRERAIPVLPPDIDESQLNFSVERGKGVRFGLTAIKGLGEGAINSILAARMELGGRIPSLDALCEILDLRLANKR